MNNSTWGFLAFVIACLFTLVCFFIAAICIEHQTVCFYVKCILYPSKNMLGLPSPKHVMKEIVNIIKNIPETGFTFIDFGSGLGEILKWVYQLKNVKNVVGVELNSNQSEQSKEIFKSITNVEILNMDMTDYEFKPTPTILFMFEPLWGMSDLTQALSIYKKVLSNLTSMYQDDTKTPLYLIYVSGHKQLVPVEFFQSFELLKKIRVPRFLGIYYNNIHFLKYRPTI